jgi:hypothetical protein
MISLPQTAAVPCLCPRAVLCDWRDRSRQGLAGLVRSHFEGRAHGTILHAPYYLSMAIAVIDNQEYYGLF